MFAEVLALAMTVQSPPPPPAAPLSAGCDVRVLAVGYRTAKPIPKARIRLRDLADSVHGKRSQRGETGPDGTVCFAAPRPLSDGLYINANSLQYRDPGPELLIATRPQEFTVRLRRRRWWMYFRYFLIGD